MLLPNLRRCWHRPRLNKVVDSGALLAVLVTLYCVLFLGYVDDRRAIAELRTLGAYVLPEPRGLYLLRQFAGDRVAERAVRVQCIGLQFDDRSLEALEGLGEVESLMIISPNVSDAGLSHLKHLEKLTGLVLLDTQVTNQGVIALRQALPGLRPVIRGPWANPEKPWAARNTSARPKIN